MTAVQPGILFAEPVQQPLSVAGKIQPNCYRMFYFSGSTKQAPVYTEPTLRLAAFTQPVAANSAGQFPVIFLNPTITYRSQLFSSTGQLLEDEDPYVPPPPFQFAKVKQAPSSRSATIIATADPELVISIPGPGTYFFEALLEFTTSGANGSNPGAVMTPVFTGAFKDFSTASFSLNGKMNTTVANAGSMNASGAGAAGAVATAYSLTGGNALDCLVVRGTFKATEPGTLAIYWAQQTSNATATTLNAGSYIRYLGVGQGQGGAGTGNILAGLPSVVNFNTVPIPPGPAIFISTFENDNGTVYIYSRDGVVWQLGALPAAVNAGGIAYGGPVGSQIWVMMTNSRATFTSTDGITWANNTTAMPSPNHWTDVCWSPTKNLFVAVSSDNPSGHQVATSPDGLTWTVRTEATVNVWYSVIWAPSVNLFIAALDNGLTTANCMTSPDGITWTMRSTPGTARARYARDLGGSFGVFCLLPSSVSYSYSPDGITWTDLGNGSFPGGGNTTGVIFNIAGVAFSILGNENGMKTNVANLNSGWVLTGTSAVGGSGMLAAAFSPSLNLWALAGGGVNNAHIVTSPNGTTYNVYNPTNARPNPLARIASSG